MSLDERLAGLSRSAALAEEPTHDGVTHALVRTRARVAARRRRRTAVVAGVAISVAALGAGGLVSSRHDAPRHPVATDDGRRDDDGSTEPPPLPEPDPPVGPGLGAGIGWGEEAPGIDTGLDAPLAARNDAATATADGALVVWGGSIEGPDVGRPELGIEAFADGAVYRSDAGWSPMAPSPLPAGAHPVAVARGPEDDQLGHDGDVVIAAGTEVAVYAPSGDAWTPLPALDAVAEQLIWIGGDEVLALTSAGPRRLRPGGWVALAAVPGGGTVAAGATVWTGDRLLAFGAGFWAPGTSLGGASWDPSDDSWTTLPAPPLGRGAGTVAAWTGDRVVVSVAYRNGTATYDPATGLWGLLDDLPLLEDEARPDLEVVDGRVVFHRHDVLVVQDGQHWTSIPSRRSLAGGRWAVAGRWAFAFGYVPGTEPVNAFARIDPAAMPDLVRRVRIGGLDLVLPNGHRLIAASGAGQFDVSASIQAPGGTCELVVVARHLGAVSGTVTRGGDGTLVATVEEVSEGGPAGTAQVGSLDCADPADTVALAAGLQSWSST